LKDILPLNIMEILFLFRNSLNKNKSRNISFFFPFLKFETKKIIHEASLPSVQTETGYISHVNR